jgi:hypothetical protein
MKKLLKEKNVGQTWFEVVCIPIHHILGFSSKGMEEFYVNGEKADSDDLRIAIDFSSGNSLLLPSTSRLVMDNEGDIHIEVLKNIES